MIMIGFKSPRVKKKSKTSRKEKGSLDGDICDWDFDEFSTDHSTNGDILLSPSTAFLI
jgi:hypothetical protein